jgi:hypothetical protein
VAVARLMHAGERRLDDAHGRLAPDASACHALSGAHVAIRGCCRLEPRCGSALRVGQARQGCACDRPRNAVRRGGRRGNAAFPRPGILPWISASSLRRALSHRRADRGGHRAEARQRRRQPRARPACRGRRARRRARQSLCRTPAGLCTRQFRAKPAEGGSNAIGSGRPVQAMRPFAPSQPCDDRRADPPSTLAALAATLDQQGVTGFVGALAARAQCRGDAFERCIIAPLGCGRLAIDKCALANRLITPGAGASTALLARMSPCRQRALRAAAQRSLSRRAACGYICGKSRDCGPCRTAPHRRVAPAGDRAGAPLRPRLRRRRPFLAMELCHGEENFRSRMARRSEIRCG